MDRSDLNDLMTKIDQQYDEMRVQAHLAKAEARDEWEDLARKWEGLKARMRAAGDEADEASEGVRAAADTILEEFKEAFERIRTRLAED